MENGWRRIFYTGKKKQKRRRSPMLESGVQDKIKAIGDSGCYALCLVKIGEIHSGCESSMEFAVGDIEQAVNEGCIGADMTVLEGAEFLGLLTFGGWTETYESADYTPQAGDYAVAEWFNPRTGDTHFTLEYPEKWNSLENSVTVKEGRIRSYRIYRLKPI
jgi:hypothetical protein